MEKLLEALHKRTCKTSAIINIMLVKRTVSRSSLDELVQQFQSLTEQAKSLVERASTVEKR